jgi:CRP-like cAMP-binding protein
MHQIFLHRDPGHPPQNALLAAMAGCLLQSLEPFLSIVSVPSGTVIYDVGNEIDRVYFPTSGLASLQFIMRDGRVIDTAIIGRNGALGVMAGIARYESKDRCVARSPLTSITISSLDLRRLVHEHRELETMCFIQMDRVLWQTQRSAACYALHTIEMRLANCLLDASEMLSSDTIPFTQDMIAEMLAVRRTSISEAAGQLYGAEIIDYKRGTIRILVAPACRNWRAVESSAGVGVDGAKRWCRKRNVCTFRASRNNSGPLIETALLRRFRSEF